MLAIPNTDLNIKISAITYITLITLCWSASIVSIIYGSYKLCRPNISQSVRKQIMVRHVLSIFFFAIAELYLQVGAFIILF